MATETPIYNKLKSAGKFELRSYPKSIIASVLVDANDHNQAGSQAFGVLADYIFGNNNSRSSIAMTAPVSAASRKNGQYIVSFTMPVKYSLASLPEPNNSLVTITPRDPYLAAVVRFSGYTSAKKTDKMTLELQTWAKSAQLKLKRSVSVLRYDAPYKPGFLRRNEISIEVDKK